MKWCLVIFTFALIWCAMGSDDDVKEADQALNDLLNGAKLPGVLDGLNISQAPTVEDAERLFKEKCLKNADMAAYERAQGAKDEAKECFLSLVNVTVLQQEMEVAKPTGDLDIVFRKYCRKSPQLRQCVSNFTSSMEPCLDEAERESKHIIQNVTDSLVQFICYKEGDRIALFIAEGGPECISDHQEDIQTCVNQTLSRHVPAGVPSVDNLPSLILGVEECKDIRALQACVVAKLETCPERTPANIVESMFNFIYKVTPCGKITQQPRVGDAAGSTGKSSTLESQAFVVLASLLGLLATRFL